MEEPAHSTQLVEVATLGGTPGTWTYAVPEELRSAATPGRRVLVPFGTRWRTGVVLRAASARPAGGTLRSLGRVLDDGPLVGGEVLELVRWAAEYYAAPPGVALRPALPPRAELVQIALPQLTEAGRRALGAPDTRPALRRALRAVDAGEARVLTDAAVRRLERDGLVELRWEAQDGAAPPVVEVAVRRSDDAAAVPARHRVQSAVWRLLLERGRVPLAELRAAVPGAREALRALAARGLAEIEQVAENRARAAAGGGGPVAPTAEQAAALQALTAALEAERPATFLLQGVTGSGKTEVYLRLIAAARARGRGAIVLVPEIALTPQLAARFRARFGVEVAVLHSGLTDRERLAEWHRVRRGAAPIVVGARSAVFAPLERPAVIIVDEEHDPSFKQENGLRYHGRDLAVVRGRLAGAVVVLGSATPSLETLHNAAAGRYGHLALSQRVDGRPLPAVELVDLRGRAAAAPAGAVAPSNLLSEPLVRALRETASRGEQSIVFLNRRGHSTAVLCRDCGEVLRCGSCAVAMTWHERGRRLVCHYCGERRGAPDTCEACGSARLLFTGAGTEKLEEELAGAVPGARIARLDRDSAATAARLERVLGRFGRGEIDVLVGTQMVAKGHDFPGVTLVCVLLADAALHQPDFRAAERTAQLLVQVAGRAGRGPQPGRVLVQTFAPDTPAVALVRDHDYAAFARAELEERRGVGYPPFRRLCLVRVEGEREQEASRIAAVLARHLAPLEGPELQVLGPAPSPLARLRGRWRFQVLLKAARPSVVGAAIARLRAAAPRVPEAVHVAVDVDPSDML